MTAANRSDSYHTIEIRNLRAKNDSQARLIVSLRHENERLRAALRRAHIRIPAPGEIRESE